MCSIFLLATYYLSTTSYIDYKLWDVFTVTAADFTVEFPISKRLWEKFIDLPESNLGDSKAVSFEAYLKKEFEKLISEQDGVLSDEP